MGRTIRQLHPDRPTFRDPCRIGDHHAESIIGKAFDRSFRRIGRLPTTAAPPAMHQDALSAARTRASASGEAQAADPSDMISQPASSTMHGQADHPSAGEPAAACRSARAQSTRSRLPAAMPGLFGVPVSTLIATTSKRSPPKAAWSRRGPAFPHGRHAPGGPEIDERDLPLKSASVIARPEGPANAISGGWSRPGDGDGCDFPLAAGRRRCADP